MTSFKNKSLIFAVLIALLLSPLPSFGSLSQESAYKSIVKIITYKENSDYMLEMSKSGSGVIISSTGYILTNSHVVSEDNDYGENVPSSFVICLTESNTEKPVCEYSADLVNKDESKDIALLKIRNISGLSGKTSFDYLTRINIDNTQEGDAVKALGYPAIGGDTITITSGTIAGKTDKYSVNWLKTDAPISFGSSGGGLINQNGELIGITSAAHSDMLASLGYVINVTSINSWIESSFSMNSLASPLQIRMNNIIVKNNQANDSTIFTNDLPKISITRPSGWEFNYETENELDIENSEDSGYFSISWHPSGILQSSMMSTTVTSLKMLDDSLINFISEEDIFINGKQGKKIVQSVFGTEMNQILIPSVNFLIVITYHYGEDDVDKTAVDQIINSIVVKDTGNNFTEQRSYTNGNPFFELSVPQEWALKENNSAYEPLTGNNYSQPNFGFSIYVEELTESTKNMSKADYLGYIKNDDVIKRGLEEMFNLKSEIYDTSVDYKINSELRHEIAYKYRFVDEDNNDEVRVVSAGYRIRDNNRVVIIGVELINGNEAEFEILQNKFEKEVLSKFSLGRPIVVEPEEEVTPVEESEGAQDIVCCQSFGYGANMNKCCFSYQETYRSQCQVMSGFVGGGKEVVDMSMCQSGSQNQNQVQVSMQVRNMTTDYALKLKGKILLQVEKNGEAWYLSPKTNKAYFLGRPADAFQVMREQGEGIARTNLDMIPYDFENTTGPDADGDGLSDLFEDAIGTDKNKKDSDGDGYLDKSELELGYNPKMSGGAKLSFNQNYANAQKGRIFLDVQNNGEAWYINPGNGKRYFLGRPADAFQVMRSLGLGISEANFENIR